MIKYSIVIPTFNHLEDCLRPCVESIIKYTTLNNFTTELVIVANGCTDGTREYVESLKDQYNINLIWFDEAIGFTRATNEGIKASRGKYIITFNNDNILLNQPVNDWLETLVAPFESQEKVGITGPMKEHCPHADRDFILFFCAMISREAIENIGLLDEIFSPGYGEDTDYSARLQDAGYAVVQVPDESRNFYDVNRRTGQFPIYHAGNKTFANWPDGDKLLARNNETLKSRYGNNKKFSLDVLKEAIGDMFYGKRNIEKAKKCDGYMADTELQWLAEAAYKANIIIEVGSWHGKSSRAIADNMKLGSILYCVDHWLGSAVERDNNHASAAMNDGDHAFMEFCDNLGDHIMNGRVIPVRMHASNALQFFKKQGIKANMIFVDAGHTYEEVKEDLKWEEALADDGVFCGHDYKHPSGVWEGVGRAVDEKFGVNNVTCPFDTHIWVVNKTKEEKKAIVKGASKPAIIDCFPFFNELDILDIRFDELFDYVDRFVVVEATKTHGGEQKPLYFADNLERYKKYLHKVTHLVVDDYPVLPSNASKTDRSWSIERYQRDSIVRALGDLRDEDILIIGDADEIPRGSRIASYDPRRGIMALEQQLYYYFFDLASRDNPWDWCKMLTYGHMKNMTPCQVRYTPFTNRQNLISNGGWHFSYISNVEGIIAKIKASAHQEYNTPQNTDYQRIEKLVLEGKDIFERPLTYQFVEIDESYPRFVLQNRNEYAKRGLIHQNILHYEHA